MSSVYPRAAVEKVVVSMDPDVLAARIIAAREENPDESMAQLVGGVLQGSDDVAGFGRAWTAVEAERRAMAALRVEDYTQAVDYVAALEAVEVLLDAGTYADAALSIAQAKEPASAEL